MYLRMPWIHWNQCEQYHYGHLKQNSIDGIQHRKMFSAHTSLFCAMAVPALTFWVDKVWYGNTLQGNLTDLTHWGRVKMDAISQTTLSKRIFLNDNVRIPIKISLKFVPKVPIINIPALVQIMAWRRLGDKPLSEPMLVSLLTHICVTRPQWVNWLCPGDNYMLVISLPSLVQAVAHHINHYWVSSFIFCRVILSVITCLI